MKFLKNKTFFTNTLIIIISGFLIKALGLINKIAITRMLGTNGMKQYVLSFPTLMLFVGMGGLSLNITISKLTSEAISTRKYSPRKLFKKACFISFIFSLILVGIYLILLKPLTYRFLKNEDLYYPLLTGVLLIPIVGFSDALKGYFNGIKQMHISSISNLIEQITRITFSVFSIYLLAPYGINVTTTFCLLALTFGEMCSIFFSLIKLKKYPIPYFDNTNGETKAILSMAIPTTGTKIIGNLTYFLEPILYTLILNYIGYETTNIQNQYTIFDAYTIPLLTLFSFLPFAISTAMIPGVSVASSNKDLKSLEYYIKKVLMFSLIPGIILAINLFFFSKEYMFLVYNTYEGTKMIKSLTFIFLFYYLQIPITNVLQAIGYSKKVFYINIFCNFLRLLLMIILAFIPSINLSSLIFATTLSMLCSFIIHFILLLNKVHFKISWSKILTLVIISIVIFNIVSLLNIFQWNYLIILLISSFLFLYLSFKFKLLSIAIFQKKKKS